MRVVGSASNNKQVMLAAPAVPMETQWVKHGDVALTRRHLQDIVNGKELADLHIDAFQNILKIQFSHIAGLLNPIYQESTPLQYNTEQMVQYCMLTSVIGQFSR